MSDTTQQSPRSTAWQTAFTMLQEVEPPFIPAGAHGMTVVIEYPPGDPGAPPHRHSGPAFGYVLEGEMVFELEGEPERILRAGETFWEPGAPGEPMITLVDEDELAQRHERRAPRTD